MVLVARKKLVEWLSCLRFTTSPLYRGWSWTIIPEYSFEERGQIFHAVMYHKLDMNARKLIFFPRADNRPPTNEQIKNVIETNYDEMFMLNNILQE